MNDMTHCSNIIYSANSTHGKNIHYMKRSGGFPLETKYQESCANVKPGQVRRTVWVSAPRMVTPAVWDHYGYSVDNVATTLDSCSVALLVILMMMMGYSPTQSSVNINRHFLTQFIFGGKSFIKSRLLDIVQNEYKGLFTSNLSRHEGCVSICNSFLPPIKVTDAEGEYKPAFPQYNVNKKSFKLVHDILSAVGAPNIFCTPVQYTNVVTIRGMQYIPLSRGFTPLCKDFSTLNSDDNFGNDDNNDDDNNSDDTRTVFKGKRRKVKPARVNNIGNQKSQPPSTTPPIMTSQQREFLMQNYSFILLSRVIPAKTFIDSGRPYESTQHRPIFIMYKDAKYAVIAECIYLRCVNSNNLVRNQECTVY